MDHNNQNYHIIKINIINGYTIKVNIPTTAAKSEFKSPKTYQSLMIILFVTIQSVTSLNVSR